jgi:peptidoglycan/xylan/chitin deacetylase (PgdA/CDA1 family)
MRRAFFIAVFTFTSSFSFSQTKHVIRDKYGAIVRGDTTRKEIAVVFTGDEFADGEKIIRTTLANHKVKGSFFFTGNFYTNSSFKKIIFDLKKEGHYLGAHSDKHLLYADWAKRDSLLVTQSTFTKDIESNFVRMNEFGISKSDAPFFIPPFEWYNAEVVNWAKQVNLTLINFTHGTRSTADYTYPQMGKSYVSSDVIYRSIVEFEAKSKNGLNGFILLIHIGTDPRRQDKFYLQLDALLTYLKNKGYHFLRIDELLR